MDIILERILSLLPHKEDGKFVRGSKKEFAQSIGYDSGDIISMWVNGSSTSYKGKIHEISAKYNVSVDWLEGKTDEKRSPAIADEASLTGTRYYELNDENRHIIDQMIEKLVKSQSGE